MRIVDCRTRREGRRLAILAALATLGATAAGASAQEPGVNYDPGSPAGKEYAIPLAQGRAEGAGTEDQQSAAKTPFGIGITPSGDSGGGSGEGSGGSDAGGGGDGAGDRRAAGDPATLRSRVADAEEAAGTAVRWTIGIALTVALAAALFAFVLRERRPHRLG